MKNIQYVEKDKKKQNNKNPNKGQEKLRQMHKEFEAQNGKLSLDDVVTIFKNKDSSDNKQYLEAKNYGNQLRGFKKRNIDIFIGRKIYDYVLQQANINPQAMTIQDKRALEALLIQDDIGSVLKSFAQKATPYLKPMAETAISMLAPQYLPLFQKFTESRDQTVGQASNYGETVRVKRRWLLTQAYQTVSGLPNSIDVNPGLKQFGQWFSQIAQCYEYYCMHSLSITYAPAVSLTTAGNISYYLDLDATHEVPPSDLIPQQYKACQHAAYQEGGISYNQEELMQYSKKLKIRNEKLIVPGDFRVYDVGFFAYVANFASTVPIGTFFVEADVSLSVPVLQIDATGADYYSHVQTWLWNDILRRPLFTNGLVSDTGQLTTSGRYYQIVTAGRLYLTTVSTSSVANNAAIVYSASSIGGTLTAWTSEYGTSAGTTTYATLSRFYKDVVPGEYMLYQANGGGASNCNQAWGILTYDPKPFANYTSAIQLGPQQQLDELKSELQQLKNQYRNKTPQRPQPIQLQQVLRQNDTQSEDYDVQF